MDVITGLAIGTGFSTVLGVVGRFMVKAASEPYYVCARCDTARVSGPVMRCRQCETEVTDLILREAANGRILRDPLVEYRKQHGLL